MPRDLSLSRQEAECLVDLLEDCDRQKVGSWRHDIAAEIRQLFGIITLEQEQENERVDKHNVARAKATKLEGVNPSAITDLLNTQPPSPEFAKENI